MYSTNDTRDSIGKEARRWRVPGWFWNNPTGKEKAGESQFRLHRPRHGLREEEEMRTRKLTIRENAAAHCDAIHTGIQKSGAFQLSRSRTIPNCTKCNPFS